MSNDLLARVAAAVEAIEAGGERPTIARVRERVKASANQVHQMVKLVQAQRRAQQDLQATTLPNETPIPPPLQAALDAVVAAHSQILMQEVDRERATSAAFRDRLEREREAERAEAQAAADDAKENASLLEEAAEEAQTYAGTLEAERAELVAAQDRLRVQLADAERRFAVMEARTNQAETRADEASAGWRAESVSRALAERRLDESQAALAAAISRAEAAERRVRIVEDDAERLRWLDRADGRLSGLSARKIAPTKMGGAGPAGRTGIKRLG